MQEALEASQRASTIEDEQQRNAALTEAKALVLHARNSQSLPRLKAMRELARSEQLIAARADEFDKWPSLLNVNNGTIDLQTGELRPHLREDMLTRLVPINYNPEADCPNWTKFLNTITGGNPELMLYLKRVAGYVLTGSSQEHAIFILHGEGQNGKSTFVNALERITGEYAAAVDSRSLLNNKNAGSGINNDLARLQGVRLAHASEPDMGKLLDEALLKKLSSGEKVTARFLHKEFFEFTPEFKLMLSANHMPEVRGNDRGIWRRLKLVPFHHTIPDADKQRDFFEKQLEPELEGILAWAVEGAMEWNQVGLDEPQIVKVATQEYRGEMDVIGQFLAEQCVVDPRFEIDTTELYLAYTSWADLRRNIPQKQQGFSRELTRRGFKDRKSGNQRFRTGLTLSSKPATQIRWGAPQEQDAQE